MGCLFWFRLNFCVFFLSRARLFVTGFVFFCVFRVLFDCGLVVVTSTINGVERLVSNITCYVSSEMLNSAHSLAYSEYG